ncbi:MAG: hypothetical protein A3G34_01450 [Candidatus Lindowbacteria bacterium RIFCSPLOWO2_12_FULL_62_27]|nr:MAG: hypothetical protein A3G34_01450 [Candidatus Lindowbacteria bacterium RIFCSPLOWO2_12_FULL_62_27]OGH61917.1 MAG: hypothetical protein A3I06_03465 [Candidatus Lindowbacteria bacterium RIFCSPLOWO2_02_FULL_62_12]
MNSFEHKSYIIDRLIEHVNVFQRHPHPVVKVVMKGFSTVLIRRAFSMRGSAMGAGLRPAADMKPLAS